VKIVARNPSKRNPLLPFYVILGLVAVAGVIVLLTQLRGKGGGATATEPVPVQIDPAELSRVQGISVGREDAPVVMYEFADYQCPHCAQWATFIEPLIKERLVQPGTVRYVFYEFPLGGAFRHSFLAARAGRCANEQGKFWEYHNLIFGRQDTWSPVDDPSDIFVQLAGDAGLNTTQFESCLRSDKYAREVTLTRQLGDKLGVQGTPTIFINGKRLEQIPGNFAELEAIVKKEAAGAASAPPAADSAPAASTPAGT
jgi:protein-disulfide isomerase